MCKIDLSLYFNAVKTRSIKVHCLTNTVVQNLTANMLLAAGAQPSMSADISEVEDFTASANALLVNLGTLTQATKLAILAAIETANKEGIPWILDPVFINRSSERLIFANKLIALRPAVIRGNRREISSFGNDEQKLAKQTGAIVVVTGEKDTITDGQKTSTLATGHPLMASVTGIGCASTAVLAAFVGLGGPPFDACSAAVELFGHIGGKAGKKSRGPGQFQINLIDELYQISQEKAPNAALI